MHNSIQLSTEEQLAANEENLDRANGYTALATLLASAADASLCQTLRDIPQLQTPETSLEVAWSLLSQAAAAYTPEQIDDEYHDLFIGVGRGEVVPYGSWHLTGFLMEKPLGVLRADLRKLGFERCEGVAESEDHIASLCQVMAAIISADDIDFETQIAFFQEHLGPWATGFFDLLQNAKTANFYRTVGNLGQCFFEVEKQYLSMSV